MKKSVKILILSKYSKEEDIILNEITSALRTLNSSFKIISKSRQDIEIEQKLQDFFELEISDADIIIPLVTVNLLSEPFIYKGAIYEILKNYNPNRIILPIFTQECMWIDSDWIEKHGMLPRSGTPFALLKNEAREAEYTNILRIISRFCEKTAEMSIGDLQTPNDVIVFISHSHEDGDFADLLKYKLKEFGIKSWVDIDNILLGDEWKNSIDYAIKGSDAVIVILSSSSRLSEYVTYEWSFALGQCKLVLPLKLKDGETHPILGRIQHLDFSRRGLRPWNELARQLKEAVVRSKNPN